ncbi:MAG: hypothetical protein ACP5IT_02605 [Thermoproteota archaeon]
MSKKIEESTTYDGGNLEKRGTIAACSLATAHLEGGEGSLLASSY